MECKGGKDTENQLAEPKILLQLDIEGHSQWFRGNPHKREAINAKANLADRVAKLMSNHGFDRISWAGDGGMYACDATLLRNYDGAVDAARAVGKEFQDWRKGDADRVNLGIRISIHRAYPVYTHETRGYWTSVDLNAFAKHERDIAVAGTIAITDGIRENLASRVASQFVESTRREVLIGGGPSQPAIIRYVYYSPLEGEDARLRQAQASLGAWLQRLSAEMGTTPSTDVGPQSAVRAAVGGAVILQFASTPATNIVVESRRSMGPKEYHDLSDAEVSTLEQSAAALRERIAELGLTDEEKVCPEQVILPLSDFPCMTIVWHPERWSTCRAFHDQLAGDGALWTRLAADAADIQSRGLRFPGLLCAHTIVRTAEPSGRSCILLCQRNPSGHEGVYHRGLWSCSIEEQVEPKETVGECVRRSISEELLGAEASAHIQPRILGLFLERSILNLTVLAVADVPLSYDEVVERWMTDPVDKDEHRQIIGLPLQRDVVVACGKCDGLAQSVRHSCLVSDESTFENTTQWSFHPTSLLRLATALWLSEEGG